jgi:hypothetical protein
VADPLFDALIAGETAREAEAKRRELRAAGDAERFRLLFSSRTALGELMEGQQFEDYEGMTLDEWRQAIDTVLNLVPKEII